jgi:hypothetical protein
MGWLMGGIGFHRWEMVVLYFVGITTFARRNEGEGKEVA